MAIEPLATTMTLQAQSVPKAVESTKVEVQTQTSEKFSQPAAVDFTTPVVASAEQKNESNQSGDESGTSQQDTEKIKKAVEELNKNMSDSAEAVFGIHEKTNRVTIKTIDKETQETIKELPPEKTLDMIAKVWEMAGMLVDEKR